LNVINLNIPCKSSEKQHDAQTTTLIKAVAFNFAYLFNHNSYSTTIINIRYVWKTYSNEISNFL